MKITKFYVVGAGLLLVVSVAFSSFTVIPFTFLKLPVDVCLLLLFICFGLICLRAITHNFSLWLKKIQEKLCLPMSVAFACKNAFY